MSNDNGRTAELYRMVTEEHICPYGLKARHLLQREGFVWAAALRCRWV